MSKKEKYKILMLGKPGGTLARTYNWHIQALNGDQKNRFNVEDVLLVTNNFSKPLNIKDYDVFWFYAKAFSPDFYSKIKELRPDAKFVCGPNVLLDKPDVGISDTWDKWYVNEAKPDIHLDQVEFYSNHVKKFLEASTREKSKCLDKCIKIDDSLYKSDETKVYDVLLYSKKRRYDTKFETFRNQLIKLLDENSLKYFEIRAGKFGKYERSEYFDALNKSKFLVNLSLDECPGILNYEAMFFNVPVIGSPHNVPVNSDSSLYVEGTDEMTEEYIVRTDSASQIYYEKISSLLKKEYNPVIQPRDFILAHTSFERYCDNVEALLS